MTKSNEIFSFMDCMNSAIFERDCEIFNNTKSAILEGSNNPIQYGIDLSIMHLPKKLVKDSYNNLIDLSDSTANLIKFYEGLYNSPKLDDTNNTVTIFDVDEIEAIKPQYLNMFMSQCANIIEEAVNGTLTNSEVAKITDPKYITILKRHMAITSIPDYISDKELAKLDNKVCINVTSVFITGRILPFLRALPMTNKALSKTITSTIDAIDSAICKMTDYVTTAKNIASQSTCVNLDNLLYTITNILLELCKYLLALLMRKTNSYINNIIEYSDLKTSFEQYFTGKEYQLGESVIDGNYNNDDYDVVNALIRGDASIQVSILNRIINKYNVIMAQDAADDSNIDSLVEVEPLNIEKFEFDKSPYVNCVRMCKTYDAALNELNQALQNPETPIQDIKNQCILLYEPETRFKDPIIRISNIDFYNGVEGTNPKLIICSIMNELKNAGSAINTIAQGIKKINFKIETLKRQISLNINDVYTNHERNDETISELDEIQNRYQSFVLLIGDGLNKRLRLLENALSLHMTHDDVHDVTRDIMIEADTTDYMAYGAERSYMLNELLREYTAEKRYNEFTKEFVNIRTSGLSEYFEATPTNNQAQTSTTQQQPQQTQPATKPVATQSNSNQISDNNVKPQVTDNSNQSNNQQQNQNNNQNSGSNNGKKLDKSFTDELCDSLSKTLQELINKLKKAFSGVGAANKKKLEDNKDALTNRSYNNVRVDDLLPFTSDNIVSQMNDVLGILKKLTPQEINSMNTTSMEERIFGKLDEKTAPGKSIGERLLHIFKFGKNNKNPKPQTVANGELKAKVPEMIDYCEKYYGTFQSELEKISNDINQTMKDLSNKMLTDQNTNASTTNMTSLSNMITMMVSSAMNASRDKANAYMVILTPFFPKDGGTNNANDNQPAQNANQNNQQPAQQQNPQPSNTDQSGQQSNQNNG